MERKTLFFLFLSVLLLITGREARADTGCPDIQLPSYCTSVCPSGFQVQNFDPTTGVFYCVDNNTGTVCKYTNPACTSNQSLQPLQIYQHLVQIALNQSTQVNGLPLSEYMMKTVLLDPEVFQKGSAFNPPTYPLREFTVLYFNLMGVIVQAIYLFIFAVLTGLGAFHGGQKLYEWWQNRGLQTGFSLNAELYKTFAKLGVGLLVIMFPVKVQIPPSQFSYTQTIYIPSIVKFAEFVGELAELGAQNLAQKIDQIATTYAIWRASKAFQIIDQYAVNNYRAKDAYFRTLQRAVYQDCFLKFQMNINPLSNPQAFISTYDNPVIWGVQALKKATEGGILDIPAVSWSYIKDKWNEWTGKLIPPRQGITVTPADRATCYNEIEAMKRAFWEKYGSATLHEAIVNSNNVLSNSQGLQQLVSLQLNWERTLGWYAVSVISITDFFNLYKIVQNALENSSFYQRYLQLTHGKESPELQAEKKAGTLVSMLEGSDEGIKGTIMYLIAFATIPPGSFIFSVNKEIAKQLAQFLASVVDKFVGIILVIAGWFGIIGLPGLVIGGLVSLLLSKVIGYSYILLALFLTWLMLILLMNFLPSAIIAFTTVLKTIEYLIRFMVLIIVSPLAIFFALYYKDWRGFETYMLETFKNAVFPLYFTSLVGLVYIVYEGFIILTKAIVAPAIEYSSTVLTNTVSNGILQKATGIALLFISSYFEALVFLIASFGGMVLIFRFLDHTPTVIEQFIDAVARGGTVNFGELFHNLRSKLSI